MDNFLMSPKIDFAFKEIMMDEKARIGFLSAVLKLEPTDIRETQILNLYLSKPHGDDKLGILDVRVLMNNAVEIDVEIQILKFNVWAARSLFYWAKMYTDQLKEGENYRMLKKCISISVLDFQLFQDQPEFYSQFHIREDTRHTLFSDKLEFHVIELPKLPPELREGDKLLLWAKFLNAERKEEFTKLSEGDEYLMSAYQRLQVISQNDEKRMEYEARRKALLDYNQGMYEAEERGKQHGIAIGEQRGEQRGIAIGEERGAKREKISMVQKMLANGESIEKIVQYTGLSAEEVNALH